MNEYFRSFIVKPIGFIDYKQGRLPVRVLQKGAGNVLSRELVLAVRQVNVLCMYKF